MSANAQHTPGWKLLPATYNEGSCVKIVSEDRNANFYALIGGKDKEANVRLIAAAPDLLAALKEIEGKCRCRCEECEPRHSMIRAAIAKAEGRT